MAWCWVHSCATCCAHCQTTAKQFLMVCYCPWSLLRLTWGAFLLFMAWGFPKKATSQITRTIVKWSLSLLECLIPKIEPNGRFSLFEGWMSRDHRLAQTKPHAWSAVKSSWILHFWNAPVSLVTYSMTLKKNTDCATQHLMQLQDNCFVAQHSSTGYCASLMHGFAPYNISVGIWLLFNDLGIPYYD